LFTEKPSAILCGMKQLVLALCLVLASGAVQAQSVYKVIQRDGSVEFTDAPPPGAPAQPIAVPSLNTPGSLLAPPIDTANQSAAGAPEGYSEFRITRPENDTSFWNTGGSVNVDLSLEPSLRAGDKIDLFLDGRSIGGGTATAITLTDMNRGSHSIRAAIKNADGQVVARSNTVTFMLQKGSLLSPQRRPTPF